MVGNNFLVRGYENGQKKIYKEEYQPTLYVKSTKESKWKTLEGENVEPIQPGTVRDCREFYKKYDSVDGFPIYGNERYVYQYISDKYPEEEIKFDISKISLVTMESSITSPLSDIKYQSELALFVKLYSFDISKRRFPHKSKIFITTFFPSPV